MWYYVIGWSRRIPDSGNIVRGHRDMIFIVFHCIVKPLILAWCLLSNFCINGKFLKLIGHPLSGRPNKRAANIKGFTVFECFLYILYGCSYSVSY